ncbi:MAG: GTP-binding protein HSR1-related protein [Chthonomonadales bacterium]|nr:GTP-binding protein HSR1-related protein [Chthonomonadales bacterium]
MNNTAYAGPNVESGQEYERYQQYRQRLLQQVKKLLTTLPKVKINDWQDTAQRIEERVLAREFRVLIVGEFKRGKSTLINSFLGEEVLPAFPIPTTAIINEVKWGETPRVILHYRPKADGTVPPPKEIAPEELEEHVVIKHDFDADPDKTEEELLTAQIRESPYDKAELFWPLDLCRNGVEIIDSPGLNEDSVRQKVTLDYLQNVDAIVFVMMCEPLGGLSEFQAIETILKPAGHDDIIFVCNRFNLIRERDREQIKRFGIAKLKNYTNKGAEHIFFVDALGALEGRLNNRPEEVAKSGVPEVTRALERFLTSDRGRIKITRTAKELQTVIYEARKKIPQLEAMYQESLETLQRRYDASVEPLRRLEMERMQILFQVRSFRADLRADVYNRALRFFRTFIEGVPERAKGMKLTNAVQLLTLKSREEQVKRVSDEIVTQLNDAFKSEFADWHKSTVTPFVTQRMEELESQLNRSAHAFVANVDKFRVNMAGGDVSAGQMQEAGGKTPSPLDRILSAVGGWVFLCPGAGVAGAAGGYKELFKAILPQLGVNILIAVLIGLNPIGLAAMVGAGLFQMWKRGGVLTNQVKEKVIELYVDQMRSRMTDDAEVAAKSLEDFLRKFEDTLDRGLNKMIQDSQAGVQEVLLTKQEGEQAQKQAQIAIAEARSEIEEIDRELNELISEALLQA